MEKARLNEITTELRLCEDVEAPVEEGQKLGEMAVYVGDEVQQTIPIVADRAVARLTLPGIFSRFLKTLFMGRLRPETPVRHPSREGRLCRPSRLRRFPKWPPLPPAEILHWFFIHVLTIRFACCIIYTNNFVAFGVILSPMTRISGLLPLILEIFANKECYLWLLQRIMRPWRSFLQ